MTALSPQQNPARRETQETTLPQRGITGRAIVLGGLLTPLNAFWIVRLERVMYGPYPSTISLFANAVFALFLLVLANTLLKRWLPRWAFQQGELLTIYTMIAISTGLAGLDGVGILSQIMPHGAWFGQARGWDKFLGAFPSWLVVSDREVLRGHFLGNTTFYQWEILRVWLTPLCAWTVFITLLMLVAHSLNLLIRKQWADRERLTFPIAWLPIEMTEEGTGANFFRNRLMWSGFLLAGGLSLWNGIAFLYPSLPAINVGITDLKPMLTVKPWSIIDWFPITFYPLAIGLGYLLPLDLLFSCWFFFFFWRGQIVLSNAMGWDTTPDFPFIKEQGFGAILGLFLFYLYTGRKMFRELGENRSALLGLGFGLLGLFVFCQMAGVRLWVTAAFFALFLPTLFVVTRVRAELGAPVHDFHFMGPDNMLSRLWGAPAFRPPDQAFFTFCFALTRAHRSDTMPIGLEGLQMAHRGGHSLSRMFLAILLATVLGTFGAFWAFEHQAYALGVTAKFNQGFGHSQQAFDRMNGWVSGTLDMRPNREAVGAMSLGFVTTLILLALRLRFFGFPFHPLGYALSSSWSIHLVWLPMIIAWTLKGITMRYGGLAAYRRFLPFFLGLILGDCVMGSVWALVSLLFQIRTYNFFGA